MLDLPDVNVWLALSSPMHSLRSRAERYWQSEARDQLAFVPVSMLGLLRLLTNSTVMQGAPLSSSEAWDVFLGWQAQPQVILLQGSNGFVDPLEAWVTSGVITGNGWTDAYLAAVAKTAGARLVTFDRGVSKLKGVDRLILTP